MRTARSKKSPFRFLILILILQWTYRDSILSSDARLRSQCANGFSVTRPSLNRSFTTRHTVSLPLRRHSRTQSQLATSVKRHSVPRTSKSRDSRARAVDARSMYLIMDIIKYLYSRDLDFLNDLEGSLSNVCYILYKFNRNKTEKTF